MKRILTALSVAVLLSANAFSQDAADEAARKEELAKKLSNPVASLISVPIETNWDHGYGPNDTTVRTTYIQPVIPFKLTESLNLITRTIVPVLDVEAPIPGARSLVINDMPVPGGEDKSGIGDINQSFFLSPQEPVKGWIVGAGPVVSYPTSSEDVLGTGKWATGPTLVVLTQRKGWTSGLLLNYVSSFAGDSDRKDISMSLHQPFLAYMFPTYTTISVNAKTTYNWIEEQWTIPVTVGVSQLLKIGKQPISLGLGWREYAEKSKGGPEYGLQATVTLLFVK